MAKIIALTSIMDDMYDAYGTFPELVAYTEALQKWDVVAMEGLPDYMKLHYRALLNLYHGAETELASQGRLYRLPYAIQSVRKLSSFLIEIKYTSCDRYVSCGFCLLDERSSGGVSRGGEMVLPEIHSHSGRVHRPCVRDHRIRHASHQLVGWNGRCRDERCVQVGIGQPTDAEGFDDSLSIHG